MTPNSRANKPSKEELERAFLDGFLAASNLLPGAEPQRTAKDPPDFFVDHDGTRVTIEVTRVFSDENKGSKLREGESNRQRVCDRVHRMIEERGVQPLLVFLNFTHDRLSKAQADKLAARIVDLVVAHDPRDNRPVELDWRPYMERGEYGSVWPELLDHVHMLRSRDWPKFEVTSSEAGYQLSSCATLLQEVISDKDSDILSYSTVSTEKWLLIVAEWMGPSSFISPDAETLETVYRSGFSRLFFYEFFGRAYFELKTAP